MAPAFELTTLAKVKEYLASSFGSTTSYDSILGDLIAEVSAQAEQIMGREVDAVSRTEEYDAHPRMRLLELRSFPASSVTSIKAAVDWDFASATAMDSDLYYLEPDQGLIHFRSAPLSIMRGYVARQAIQVVYTGGMAADQSAFITAYPNIVSAVTRQVVHAFQRRTGFGASTIDINNANTVHTREYSLLDDVVRVLRSYRRPPIG